MSGIGTKQTRDGAVKTEHILRPSRPSTRKKCAALPLLSAGFPVKGKASEHSDATSREPILAPH